MKQGQGDRSLALVGRFKTAVSPVKGARVVEGKMVARHRGASVCGKVVGRWAGRQTWSRGVCL